MSKLKIPATTAIRFLKQHKVKFVPHPYPYEDKGGTKASAKALNVPEFSVIKTLVMEDDQQQAFIVLMHGSCEVSLKHLARQLRVKQVIPCNPDKADRLSPALIINDFDDGDIIVCRITSQIYKTRNDIYIDNWKKSGLMAASAACWSRFPRRI